MAEGGGCAVLLSVGFFSPKRPGARLQGPPPLLLDLLPARRARATAFRACIYSPHEVSVSKTPREIRILFTHGVGSKELLITA